jgi:error-prone DNA polymerase
MIGGLREAHGKLIEQVRAGGPFVSIDDFARRTGLGQAVIKRLAEADAFGSVGAGRRQALWHALGQEKKRRAMPLFELREGEAPAEPLENGTCKYGSAGASPSQVAGKVHCALPPMQLYEEVVADYRTAGLSLRAHPISFYRDQLERLGITRAQQLVELKNDAPVRVAGLVLLRQRPGTAKGITFVTLEDETGVVNLIVRQEVWERYRRVAKTAKIMVAHGTLQVQGEIVHVLVTKMENFSARLAIEAKSRDFR